MPHRPCGVRFLQRVSNFTYHCPSQSTNTDTFSWYRYQTTWSYSVIEVGESISIATYRQHFAQPWQGCSDCFTSGRSAGSAFVSPGDFHISRGPPRRRPNLPAAECESEA